MTADIRHRKTPEEEELDKKIALLNELASELAQRELDLATLRGELKGFEIRYIRIIGTRYAELDEIVAQVAEIQARQSRRIRNHKNMRRGLVRKPRNQPMPLKVSEINSNRKNLLPQKA